MALIANVRTMKGLREIEHEGFESLVEMCGIKNFKLKRRLAISIQSAKRVAAQSVPKRPNSPPQKRKRKILLKFDNEKVQTQSTPPRRPDVHEKVSNPTKKQD